MHSKLSNRIRAARHAAGLSQAELAVLLMVSASAVAHWERAAATPGADRLGALARLASVHVRWLISGEGPMHAPHPHALQPMAAEPTPAPALSRAEQRLLASFRRMNGPAQQALLRFADQTASAA